MVYVVSVANIWRFELIGVDNFNGAEFMSHVHYQTDVPVGGSEPDASEILDHTLSHFSSSGHNLTAWTNVMTNNSQLTEARVREEVTPGSGDVPAVASNALALPGTLGGAGTDALPSAMCVWIAYVTAAAIRGGRGGTHAPPTMAASFLNGAGAWDTATGYWTNMLTLAAAIKTSFSGGGTFPADINPKVYSRTRRARGFDPFTFALTNAVPSNAPRWLRRRES
jgi:hypothetical protein